MHEGKVTTKTLLCTFIVFVFSYLIELRERDAPWNKKREERRANICSLIHPSLSPLNSLAHLLKQLTFAFLLHLPHIQEMLHTQSHFVVALSGTQIRLDLVSSLLSIVSPFI